MAEENRAVKSGHGLIRISLNRIHDLLRLPAGYEVVGMSHDYYRNDLNIYVQSDELSPVEEGALLPVLNPVYSRDENGVVELLHIERE